MGGVGVGRVPEGLPEMRAVDDFQPDNLASEGNRMKRLWVSKKWATLCMQSTWNDVFADTVKKHGEKEALVFTDTNERITYGEYDAKVNELAKALFAIGVRKGTHVGLWMTNRPEWCFTRFAIYRLGAIMIPFHTRYKLEELRYVLKQSDTKVLLFEDNFIGKIDAIGMVGELVPEMRSSNPEALNSAEFPELSTLVCLGKRLYPGTYSWDEFLDKGKTIQDEDIQIKVFPQDTIHILYTSGTTGFPKGVETPCSCNMAFNAIPAELYDLNEDSRYLNINPFFGNMGIWNQTLSILTGCVLVVSGSAFDPKQTLETIAKEKITNAIFVPTMLIDILNHPDFDKYEVSSLKRIVCAGAVVPQTLIKSVKDKLGLYLMNVYGLVEASGISTWVPYGDTPEHVEKSVGLPLPNCELAILDFHGKPLPPGEEGEICTREVFPGSQHMKGYYKKHELTAETIRGGWLHSGDVGKMDEDGYVYITGRRKEMFTVGGFNVSPAEVENYLIKYPKISHVAVVGVPDERLGEVGAAFVVLKQGAAASQDEILDFCEGKISNVKTPKYVFFVEELPQTPQGKVQKFKLRELFMKERIGG